MTRQEAPVEPPVVLTIAGSDSGGGAGIQADLKTIEAGGAFGTSAITSVTAQNTTGVESTHVLPINEIDAQCGAVCSDFDVAAVKTGMLAATDVVELVTERVRETEVPAVVDPVMVAASGDRLLASEAETAYEDLVAEAALVTPNADEAAVLTDIDPDGEAEAREAGERLVEGHIPGDDVVDVLVTGDGVDVFRHSRVDTDATHGSGCALSSAIATRLAHGDDLVDAVGAGIGLLARAVRYNLDVGEGPGAVHHAVETRDRAARDETAEAVEGVVQSFVDRNVGPLVPEVGTNVAGATPYAERPGETAAVEGRITRTRSGAQPNCGVRFGASTHVARLLLAARERDPRLRFAANCRYDGPVADTLSTLDGPVAEFDRADASASAGADAVEWGSETAFDAVDGTPAAVVDHGASGDEPLVFLLAREPDALVDRTLTLLEAVESEA
ncbi:bifunctional hydroxymethylpyrimidine kinase/phosphomethylpyrimidine kinase [Halobacteriales archaeon QS_9_67_15]|nr:MAG: bifunctional hydroxymethylpyrimidine kinase/phosphomethylpyrimidine kinase [Halobacteriales archaeon QS_9_67_15]